MNKQEFEKKLGLGEISDQAFRIGEALYLNLAGEEGEEKFFKDLRDLPGLLVSRIVFFLCERISIDQTVRDKIASQQRDLQTLLLKTATEADSIDLWDEIAEKVGRAEVIRYKVDNQLDLTEKDRAYIIENLK